MGKYWINTRCLCPECENIELMLHGIPKACDQVNLPLKCHDLIGKVDCNPIKELYAEGKCENYPEINLKTFADCDSITYYRWWWGEKYYEEEQGQNYNSSWNEGWHQGY